VRALRRDRPLLLAVELVVCAVAVLASGAERSWLFLLWLLPVAGRLAVPSRGVLVLAHLPVACHACVVGLAALGQGRAVDWPAAGVRLAVLWIAGLYLAGSTLVAERRRAERDRGPVTLGEGAARPRPSSGGSGGATASREHEQPVAPAPAESRAPAHARLPGTGGDRERTSQARSQFLANISHELRTPLNGVAGAFRLLLDTELTPAQRQYLELGRAAADTLLALVDDVLDFSKAEAGKLELERRPFSVRGMVADSLKPLTLRAGAKGLALASDVLPDVPDAVLGDAARLKQVIMNLVGNAIKFTDAGEIVVHVEVAALAPREITLHVAVRDTGIGIPRSRHEAIFEPFTQADGSTTRTHGGSGLGLSIASRLVRLMGGRIWLDSEVGRGSTFHFVVPLGVEAGEASAGQDDAGLAGLSALIAEPNPAHRSMLVDTLRAWRVEVAEAEAGQQALDALERAAAAGAPYDVVLLAIDLPGLDGLRVAERIRETPGLARRLVMMMRAVSRRGDAERCVALRPDAVLTRPIDHASLRAAIAGAPDPAAAPADPAAAPAAGRPAPRPARRLHVLLAEDNSINRALAVGLLEGRGHRVTVADDGAAALAAVESGRFDVIVMDVHMPALDGLEVTRAIRARETECGGRVPIVAFTAQAMPGDRERCLAAGMDAYLAKPLDAAELFATLERLGARAGAPVDVSALRARVDGDVELERRIVQLFLDHAPGMLARVREAVEQRDASALTDAAHTLAGALANFPSASAAQAARRLEGMGRTAELDGAQQACAALAEELERLRAALAPLAGDHR
jgi:signal transduction histidine kinase/DNA-binding response OmpR family regulator